MRIEPNCSVSFRFTPFARSHYAHAILSVDLFNHAAEAACMINNTDAVMSFSETLIANARSYDDKLASEWDGIPSSLLSFLLYFSLYSQICPYAH